MENVPGKLPRAERATPVPDQDILLVGNPNVGKSALFGALTGSYVTVSNYPGTTVEIARGNATVAGRKRAVIDTPGANSFLPTTDDERVTRDVLLERDGGPVIAVGDAKNLQRTSLLAVQLAEMEVPFVLALNMMDEAEHRGIAVDTAELGCALGVQVVPTVATRGIGVERLRRALSSPKVGDIRIEYAAEIEHALVRLEPLLPPTTVSSRALGVMALAGDPALLDWLRERTPEGTVTRIEAIRAGTQGSFREPLAYVINRTRLAIAETIAARTSRRRADVGAAGKLTARLEAATTHPLWGLPVLALALFAAYQFVGVFGAGTLVDGLESVVFGEWINPWAIALADRLVPFQWGRDLLVGEYGLVTMALTYSLALVFPIVGTFFNAFGVLEDSGYLPRLAVMVNRSMKSIGLNGKAVLPMILGLGCDTMATLTTRILETKKERLIVILLLALGVPCSAQLTVILAMLGSLSGVAVAIWFGVVLGVIFVVGRLASRMLPGRGSDFVLELPPLRLPRMRNILVKTLGRIEWYLKEAVPLFVLGTMILFVADRLRLLGALERAAEPVLTGVLGLPAETAQAFIIGFLRRDFGAAGLYHMAEAGRLDAIQVVVAVVVITLFIPCIAHFFMIVKERGWKTGAAIAGFIFPFALAVGASLNWILRALPWQL